MTNKPVILWFRRDLRLADHAALQAAVSTGRPVVPLFVLDDETSGAWKPGSATRWWLHHSLAALDADLRGRGSRLVLRRGAYADVLPALVAETGAGEIHVGEPIEPWARRSIDALAKTLPITRHRTGLMFHPDSIRTGSGTPYGVFTPYARACRRAFRPHAPAAAPKSLSAPAWPASDSLAEWHLLPTKPDWSTAFDHTPGEAGARTALKAFLPGVGGYDTQRNLPGVTGTSRLSPHLAWGEISPDAVWAAAAETGGDGLETYTSELLWREFSANLLWHFPSLPDQPLKPAYAAFPFRTDAAALAAWQHGRTGIPIVDAGMRQLWQSGWMHNRVRMIVASFLIKHLLIDWREGEAWFWDCLVDAELGANSASWQWVAGSGADAAPFFRIFNPVTQGEKFDTDGSYVRRWVKELAHVPAKYVHAPWTAPSPPTGYPKPIVDLAYGRARALDALKTITK